MDALLTPSLLIGTAVVGGALSLGCLFVGQKIVVWGHSLETESQRTAFKVTGFAIMTFGCMLGAATSIPLFLFTPLLSTKIILSSLGPIISAIQMLGSFTYLASQIKKEKERVSYLEQEKKRELREKQRLKIEKKNYLNTFKDQLGKKTKCPLLPNFIQCLPIDILSYLTQFLAPANVVELWRAFESLKKAGMSERISKLALAIIEHPNYDKKLCPYRFVCFTQSRDTAFKVQVRKWIDQANIKNISRFNFVRQICSIDWLFLKHATRLSQLDVSRENFSRIFGNPDNLRQLPHSLTDLRLGILINHHQALSLPPYLEKLKCYGIEDALSIEQLPSSLTALKLKGGKRLSTDITQKWPPHLTELDLCKGFDILPPNLKKLTVRLGQLNNLSQLPQSLTFLKLESPTLPNSWSLKRKEKTHRENHDHLPSNLHTFIYSEALHFSSFRDLPKSLKHLEIGRSYLNEKTSKALASLPQLTTLITTTGFSDTYMRHLPSSITKLHIGCSTLTDNCIPHLPQNLRSLSIVGFPSFSFCGFSKEGRIKLPWYLDGELNHDRAQAFYEAYQLVRSKT